MWQCAYNVVVFGQPRFPALHPLLFPVDRVSLHWFLGAPENHISLLIQFSQPRHGLSGLSRYYLELCLVISRVGTSIIARLEFQYLI